MKSGILHIIFISLFFLPKLQAQISPGDLTKAHADLEGISNCTQCHTLGDKVSNNKCLDCHKEINNLIDNRLGYHASKEVKGKDCATCHSEHHGRGFEMVRFDEDNFDHRLTGYPLTGAHQKTDCRQCHIPDFIENRDLKKRKDTYLGLIQDCVACHEDVHQKTLSLDCVNCHNTDAFAPAPNFNHHEADFKLKGKHKEIDCVACHQVETRQGKEFQVFVGLKFENCNSCHEDVHQNNLGTNCKQCHSEESFTAMSQVKKFNHHQTHFPLKGAHQRINCADCHNMSASPALIFQDKLGIGLADCVRCHEDVHDNKFGTNCVECHHEESFQQVNMSNFNHSLTDFDLIGKHAVVDCRQCHVESLTEPLPHNECKVCHEDYHEGEFVNNGFSPDCASCHTEEGFDVTLYTIEQHNATNFPLDGGHAATPCFACHLQEDQWHFRNIGQRCVDCHEDVHQGYIAEEFYPQQDCEKCHSTADWFDNHFDHNLTKFKLEGVHLEQNCMDCHAVSDKSHMTRYEGFVNLPIECYTCHENVHHNQFEKNGVTDCNRCHGFESWEMSDFNHDKTNFKLEGKHAEIACDACHQPININGEIITQYKFESFECVVCHQ